MGKKGDTISSTLDLFYTCSKEVSNRAFHNSCVFRAFIAFFSDPPLFADEVARRFHLASLSEWQIKAVAALSSLLSEKPGSMIFGRQVGVPIGRSGPRPRAEGVGDRSNPMFLIPFRHDKNSFKAVFEEQAKIQGREGMWKVDCRHREFNGLARGRELPDDEPRGEEIERENLSFVVTRC